MTFSPKNTVVWTEIPVTDMDAAIKFYNAALDYGLTLDTSGPNPVAMLPSNNDTGVAGHLYPGKPATGNGPTLHLAIPGKLEDSVKAWTKAGGTVISDPITIPPGRFAYATDPDGNSIGLFESAKG